MLWATARLVHLLSCQWGAVVPAIVGAETQVEGASGGPPDRSIDELVMVWESIHLGPFQMEVIEGQVKPFLGDTSYVMITPLRVEGQPRETKALPPGLHVLHAYTRLKNGRGKVSLVVRNMSDSHIFLKKGVPVAWVVSASLCATCQIFTREGSHARCRISTRIHVGGGETGKVAGEIELGRVGPLVPRECSGGERVSSGL